MTFQNSKKSSAPNFEIIIEDQTVYFTDYPDFPIFEKTIFPEEAWEQMNIDFKKLIDDILYERKNLEVLHDLLKEEFKSLQTPEDRKTFLDERRVENNRILDRFDEIMDLSFALNGEIDEELKTEASHLHHIIKYDICISKPISEYSEALEALLLSAIYKQGYDVDPCVGEITKLPTTDFSQETHP